MNARRDGTRAAMRGAVTAAALVLASRAEAFSLRGHVVGQGATPAAGIAAGSYRMLGTLGQPVVGVSGGTNDIVCHGYWCFGGARVVDVPPGGPGGPGTPAALPTKLEFGAPMPNPTRDAAAFSLALPAAARVELSVHDVTGRLLDRAEPVDLAAGVHRVRWTGGGRLAAGLYFARLRVDGRVVGERRVVVVR